MIPTISNELKQIGGSKSDHWNTILANQTLSTLWVHGLHEEREAVAPVDACPVSKRGMLTLEAFFDGAAATSSTRRQSCHSLGPGGIGDQFVGVSPCLRPNTFIPNSAIALPNNAFSAASGSRWHVLVWQGSVRP
jgi:hypothetical protein